MIIGITGTLGAGKGTVVKYLISKGFKHYSSSGILKEILAERGLPQTRFNLSALADELLKAHEGGILHLSHERAQQEGAENYVLEAIHRVDEANYIHSIGGKLLGVDADVEKRYERIAKRKEGEKDNVTREQFLADVQREDEGGGGTGSNIRETLKTADAIVINDGTPEDLFAQVESALAKYTQS